MRTIAINLGDNDFWGTMRPLLETIYRAMEWNDFKMSKEEIELCIITGLRFHYLAFQHGTRHGKSGYGTTDSTVSYLTHRCKVLFDEEAEKDIETNFNNGEAWYLEVQTGKIYSY